MAHNPVAQLPLYLPPQRCYTCGKPFSLRWLQYTKARLETTDSKPADLPLKIVTKKDILDKKQRTTEAEIMDELNMMRYCCRRMFLGQPETEVPPPENLLEPDE
jgi:DNA-directed RNA polymerase subunit N (RpoN/RPB10)